MPVKTTHKPNERHDAVFVTIEGETTDQYVTEAQAFLAANGVELALHVDQTVKAGGTLAAGGLQPQPPAPVQAAPQPAATPPAWAAPAGQQQAAPAAPAGKQTHPAGKTCDTCGTVLTYVTGNRNGKQWSAWKCESAPRGDRTHTVEWL